MSSLQKFHRRTNNAPAGGFTTIGSGSDMIGYWVAGITSDKLIVSPISSETNVNIPWGSIGIIRGTTSTTNGLANTNTLYAFGSAAHPAAYYCKTLTTGGYTTWYLPAKDELSSCYTARLSTPFSISNAFRINTAYRTSTEFNANDAWGVTVQANLTNNGLTKSVGGYTVRAIRRTSV